MQNHPNLETRNKLNSLTDQQLLFKFEQDPLLARYYLRYFTDRINNYLTTVTRNTELEQQVSKIMADVAEIKNKQYNSWKNYFAAYSPGYTTTEIIDFMELPPDIKNKLSYENKVVLTLDFLNSWFANYIVSNNLLNHDKQTFKLDSYLTELFKEHSEAFTINGSVNFIELYLLLSKYFKPAPAVINMIDKEELFQQSVDLKTQFKTAYK